MHVLAFGAWNIRFFIWVTWNSGMTHTPDKCFNSKVSVIWPVWFQFQLCVTLVSYWRQTDMPMASLKQQKGSCLMRSLLKDVKSWPTCCSTWRTDLSWRAGRSMKNGSKVQSLETYMSCWLHGLHTYATIKKKKKKCHKMLFLILKEYLTHKIIHDLIDTLNSWRKHYLALPKKI